MKYPLDKVIIYQRNQLLKKIIRRARGKGECFSFIRRNRLSRSMTREINHARRNGEGLFKELKCFGRNEGIIKISRS